ncbi:hypothetical protein INR49_006695 [Caranx melampygus]|nr:hypothetical protein INR49_006695 [Caranx melampygus]
MIEQLLKMKVISAVLLSVLFCTVKEERRTAFFGEDIHFDVPPGNVGEVVFKPRTNHSAEVALMRNGKVVSPRGHLNSLGHLVLEDVQEEDEGVYVIKNRKNPNAVKQLVLIVRDCAIEQVVKYGDPYLIPLNHVEGPITLEFRPSLVQANQTEVQQTTEAPPVFLYQMGETAEEYVGRLSVSEKQVTLRSVRMTDEGSFTVLDREGKVRRRNCLNVREHQDFVHLPYGGNLKMKLYVHHSNLNVIYRPKSDNQDRVVLDQGVVVTPLDPMLEGRLTVEGSELTMKKVHVSDIGIFKVTDLAGFPVAYVYIEVEAYKLPPLTMAILSLLGLIAFMLLVCLLSCIYKVHKRNEKNKKLMLIAQQAGKGDGEAFRQGLEVSKPGRYQTLTSDNFLEMSDSGVEFTSSGLPLDSDTEAVMTYASHKPLLNAASPTATTGAVNSDSLEATVVPDLSASRTPDSAMSGSPASNPRSLTAATPDGSLHGAASPGATSRGTTGSDPGQTEGGAEGGDGEQKEESAPST